MTGNERKSWVWQFTVNDVKICTADSTGGHSDSDFSEPGVPFGNILLC